MKNLTYTAELQEIKMPQSKSVLVWEEFFNHLMDVDYFSPFHAVMARYHITADEDFDLPPSAYGGLYYDLGIEMCADDRYPAEDAAILTGFFQKGVSMIVCAAAGSEHDPNLMAAVREVFKQPEISDLISADVAAIAANLLNKNEAPDSADAKSGSGGIDDIKLWIKRFEGEMMTDANAAASIMGYFLGTKIGRHCSIFCPLGYEPYETLGKEMAMNHVAFEAAKTSGLLVKGVTQYVSAALSNEGCWCSMSDGVAFLVENPELACFIPFRDRYIAERMVRLYVNNEEGEEAWNNLYQRLSNELRNEWNGY